MSRHEAVLDTMRELERTGFEVSYLDVRSDGLLSLDTLKAAIRPDTILVSVMHVNNEIGVIQDSPAIDLSRLPVDLMSLSAHKTYGPKGIGALYARRKPRVRIEARRHPTAGGALSRPLQQGESPQPEAHAGGVEGADQLLLAGQCARARELHRAPRRWCRAMRSAIWPTEHVVPVGERPPLPAEPPGDERERLIWAMEQCG